MCVTCRGVCATHLSVSSLTSARAPQYDVLMTKPETVQRETVAQALARGLKIQRIKAKTVDATPLSLVCRIRTLHAHLRAR